MQSVIGKYAHTITKSNTDACHRLESVEKGICEISCSKLPPVCVCVCPFFKKKKKLRQKCAGPFVCMCVHAKVCAHTRCLCVHTHGVCVCTHTVSVCAHTVSVCV